MTGSGASRSGSHARSPDSQDSRDSGLTPPPGLEWFQAAFGQSLSTPFDFSTGRFREQKENYASQALAAVKPRPPQTAAGRLAVYNQQYWYRLFTLLQKVFPLLRHVLGVWHFNQLASEYLEAHPPRSPYLDGLPSAMPEFIRSSSRWNSPLHVEIAAAETWRHRSHWLCHPQPPPEDPAEFARTEPGGGEGSRPASRYPGAGDKPGDESLAACAHSAKTKGEEFAGTPPGGDTGDGESDWTQKPLVLHPSWMLFEEHWDILDNLPRAKADKDDKLVIELKRRHRYWALSRPRSAILHTPLSKIQFGLLEKLNRGITLEAACESTSRGLSRRDRRIFERGLQSWFTYWSSLGWFEQMPKTS